MSLFRLEEKRIIILSVIAAILMIGGFIAYLVLVEQKISTVAIVNGKKVSLDDYKARVFAATGEGTVQRPTGFNEYIKETILNQLINEKIIKEEFEKNSLKLAENEIERKAKEINANYETLGAQEKIALKKYASYRLMEQGLGGKIVTWREGKYLLCRYDRYLQEDLVKTDQEQPLKEKQEKYAESYCKGISERLAAGSSDYETEKKKLLEDAVIGNESWQPFFMTLAHEFNQDNFSIDKFVIGSDLRDKILAADKTKKVSDPIKIRVEKDIETKEKVEGAYAIVILENKGNDGMTINFEEYIEGKNQNLEKTGNIKKFVERIKL